MRGKADPKKHRTRQAGITPAYAGKSWWWGPSLPSTRDHPRVCGEKFDNPKIDNSQLGSPPRMRGKGSGFGCCPCRPGITPAYAGKSLLFWHFLPGRWDHPRVCGEKCPAVPLRCVLKGSPPRMRGKGVNPCNQRVAVRITPAYAGKRVMQHPIERGDGDHPRVCGEKRPAGRCGI